MARRPMTRVRSRGSALLLATVVMIIILGVGGAFLALTVGNGKNQVASNHADDALLICDGGLEKVRRALYLYKKNSTWSWDNILQYCQSAPAKRAEDMPGDLAGLWNAQGSPFRTYLADASGVDTDPASEAVVPSNPQAWSSSPGGNIYIAQYIPYHNGAFYAFVSNNDDSAINGNGAVGSPTHDSDNILVVTVVGTTRSGVQRRIKAVLQYIQPTSTFPGLAAIVSRDPISFNGNITIDGRDYDINGTSVVGPGVFAAMSGGTVGYGGSSAAGGRGLAPVSGGAAGATDQNHADWSALNAAPSGGGATPSTFPSDPDAAIKAPSGSLKNAAISSGTYFTSQTAYNAYVSANGGVVPGGKIIYCDFTPGPPFELGSSYNNPPSILVVHNSTGTADMKNVHGDFKGLIIADSITHINAGTNILGSVLAWGQSGNVFGNGNSNVRFSSAVLNNLPGLAPSNSLGVVSVTKEVPAGLLP